MASWSPVPGSEDAFMERLVSEGLAPSTIRNYRGKLRHAQAWCSDHDLHLEELTAFQVAELAESVPYSYSSRAHLRNTLIRYWGVVGRSDPPIGAVRIPPKPDPECRAVTRDEARLLVKASLNRYPEGLAVLIGMYMALRASEIAAFRLDRYDGRSYLRMGKAGRVKRLPVHPLLAHQIEQVPSGGDFLFPGGRGRRHATYQTVWNWVRAVCSVAGIPMIQPHQLRHTALATGNDNTGDLRAVGALAGHRDIRSTMIYTRTSEAALWDVVMSLDYLE